MTREDAEALLAANDGQKICVAYRTKTDGTIVHRPDPRPLAVAVLALGLAACTGHTPEVEYPGEHCQDPHGYEQDCDDADGDIPPQIPDEVPPVANDEERPPDAIPSPELPPHVDDFVGLVEVDDMPDISPRVGTISVDARAIRQSDREEKRAERRARRAAE